MDFRSITIRFVFLLASIVTMEDQADAQILLKDTELLSLEMIPIDLAYANQLMTAYDLDDSGTIDKQEQKRLRWKDEVKQFDLDRNGELTQLELAIREAKRRDSHDITQFDIDNVKRILRAHDTNRNGQLDRDEIRDGWIGDPNECDTNKDGVLSAREMHRSSAFQRTIQREQGIEGIDHSRAVDLVRDHDQDGDSQLNSDEEIGMNLPGAASDFDQNDNGKLDILELATMLAKRRLDLGMTSWDQKQVDAFFDRFDRNADGKVSSDDVGDQVLAKLKEHDLNSDKVITVSEVERVYSEKRKILGYTKDDYHRAKAMLLRHDLNRSKGIELSELFERPSSGQLPKSVLKSADQNGDKRVDVDELARYFNGKAGRENDESK